MNSNDAGQPTQRNDLNEVITVRMQTFWAL